MWIGAIALVFSTGMVLTPPQDAPAGPPWQLPDEALGTRMAPILLLSRPDVRQELSLSEDQAESARGAIVELFRQAAALRGREGADVVAARRAVDEAARRWLDEHLTAEQLARLSQVELQWEGAAALVRRPTIAASLGLSDEQRLKLSQAIAGPTAPGANPIESHRVRHREAAEILTEDQRLRWLAMLGPPFEPGVVRTADASSAPSTGG